MISGYGLRKQRVYEHLAELNTIIDHIIETEAPCPTARHLVGWDLREEIFVTLERLPRSEMRTRLKENDKRVRQAMELTITERPKISAQSVQHRQVEPLRKNRFQRRSEVRKAVANSRASSRAGPYGLTGRASVVARP